MFARRREEKREDFARKLLPVYLALKYTLVHVFGESTIHGRSVPFAGIVSKFKLHSAKRKSPSLRLDRHSRNANISRSRREILQLHENPRAAGARCKHTGVFEVAHSHLSPCSGFLYKGMNSARHSRMIPRTNVHHDACNGEIFGFSTIVHREESSS